MSTVNPKGAYEQEALYWYPRQMSTLMEQRQNLRRQLSMTISFCNRSYSSPLTYIEEKEKRRASFCQYDSNERKTLARQTEETIYYMRRVYPASAGLAELLLLLTTRGEGNNREVHSPLINRLDYSTQTSLHAILIWGL